MSINYHNESSHASFSICILYNILLIKFEETLSKTLVIGSINFAHFIMYMPCNVIVLVLLVVDSNY
jgi:hypothetical protein